MTLVIYRVSGGKAVLDTESFKHLAIHAIRAVPHTPAHQGPVARCAAKGVQSGLRAASEIRLGRLRNRMDVLIEVLPAALGANHLRHRRRVFAPCLGKCERPVERVGIFHRYDRG